MAKPIKKKAYPKAGDIVSKITPVATAESILGGKNEGTVKLVEQGRDENNWHWDKHEITSPESAPIIDPGDGKQRLIRRFLVCTPPDSKVTAEEVLKHHKRSLLENLARDGWEPVEEPKILQLYKKDLTKHDWLSLPPFASDMHIFAIYFTCQAGYGVIREHDKQTPFSATELIKTAQKTHDNSRKSQN